MFPSFNLNKIRLNRNLSKPGSMKKVSKSLTVLIFAGIMITFTGCQKNIDIPSLTTTPVSEITSTSGITGGNVTSSGGAEVIARGVCWATTHNPSIVSNKVPAGTGIGLFTSEITDLMANITYYIRAYATNSAGTAYGNEVSFTTNPLTQATITTDTIINITIVSAQLYGTISNNGGATITEMGFCWDTKTNPSLASSHKSGGTDDDSLSAIIGGLLPATTYYVRSYATNSQGTSYGNELSFTTRILEGINFNPELTYGSVSDIEGNVYKTIIIGTQTWMAENLKATKYSNGDLIGTTTPALLDISGEYEPKYQWAYDGAESLVATFGRLYTYYAVSDSRNVCPAGWHVPADEEWSMLRDFLGGEIPAGGKLKEGSLAHWFEPNTAATNETGFTALPAGYRNNSYGFNNLGFDAYWWSSTYYDITSGWAWSMEYTTGNILSGRGYDLHGISVRCLMDD
jgi:uncharacterized protein (TIGR02145 family)